MAIASLENRVNHFTLPPMSSHGDLYDFMQKITKPKSALNADRYWYTYFFFFKGLRGFKQCWTRNHAVLSSSAMRLAIYLTNAQGNTAQLSWVDFYLAIINIQLEKTQISARTPGHWRNRKVVKSMPLTSRLSSRCPLREDESYRKNEDSEGNDYTLYRASGWQWWWSEQ